MNSILIKAVVVVTFALAFYSIGVITEQRKSFISKTILFFLTAGVTFDISSTVLMITGSANIPFTVHGMLGYSALTVMLIDIILIWRHWIKAKGDPVPKGLNIYTRLAYCWWVVAYFAGAAISMTL